MDRYTYLNKVLIDNGYDDQDTLPDTERVPLQRYVLVLMDDSASNPPFVKTFASLDEMNEYWGTGAFWDETNTRGEQWTDWKIFQVHDLDVPAPMQIRLGIIVLGVDPDYKPNA